jgi:hypothetical protein
MGALTNVIIEVITPYGGDSLSVSRARCIALIKNICNSRLHQEPVWRSADVKVNALDLNEHAFRHVISAYLTTPTSAFGVSVPAANPFGPNVLDFMSCPASALSGLPDLGNLEQYFSSLVQQQQSPQGQQQVSRARYNMLFAYVRASVCLGRYTADCASAAATALSLLDQADGSAEHEGFLSAARGQCLLMLDSASGESRAEAQQLLDRSVAAFLCAASNPVLPSAVAPLLVAAHRLVIPQVSLARDESVCVVEKRARIFASMAQTEAKLSRKDIARDLCQCALTELQSVADDAEAPPAAAAVGGKHPVVCAQLAAQYQQLQATISQLGLGVLAPMDVQVVPVISAPAAVAEDAPAAAVIPETPPPPAAAATAAAAASADPQQRTIP